MQRTPTPWVVRINGQWRGVVTASSDAALRGKLQRLDSAVFGAQPLGLEAVSDDEITVYSEFDGTKIAALLRKE